MHARHPTTGLNAKSKGRFAEWLHFWLQRIERLRRQKHKKLQIERLIEELDERLIEDVTGLTRHELEQELRQSSKGTRKRIARVMEHGDFGGRAD